MEDRRYPGFVIENEGQVATVRMLPNSPISEIDATTPGHHWELGAIFSDLRGDNSVRVVVLTGAEDGAFMIPPPSDYYTSPEGKRLRNDPLRIWHIFTGIVRCHEAMAALEKPIVARVNGDAIGFGSSIMFACDLIVARDDARIADHHLGVGEVEPYGPPYGMVPGDGGMALVPLYMTPAKAKEYLMLATEYRARDLAQAGIINYAVPPSELDTTVNDLVERLLKRPAYALAWTKRVTNRRVVEHLNLTLDAGAAYEMVAFHQMERQGWVDRKTLE
jgi:enoyl-CoA hydratase/carnithine racemase